MKNHQLMMYQRDRMSLTVNINYTMPLTKLMARHLTRNGEHLLKNFLYLNKIL